MCIIGLEIHIIKNAIIHIKIGNKLKKLPNKQLLPNGLEIPQPMRRQIHLLPFLVLGWIA